jgi:putative ABC transport system substrate-binding protein
MDRRHFLLSSLAGTLASPLAAAAQQAVKRVGLVGLTGPTSMSIPVYQAFQRRLAELGWVEGRNLAFESRWAEGQVQRLPQLIDEVVAAQPEVIYVLSSAGAVAAKKANLKIPVVFSHVTDPVASGVVPALGRHGGNITGVTYSVPETASKLLEFLREVRPSLRGIGVVWTTGQPGKLPELEQLMAAAKNVDVQVVRLEARDAADYLKLMNQSRPQNVEGLVVLADPLSFNLRAQLTDFAAKQLLPAVYQQRDYVEAGGLMSYGIDVAAVGRRVAELVDKILRGAKPADLPVEQPTTFELVVSLKAAKALGLIIPPSLLARAHHIIE